MKKRKRYQSLFEGRRTDILNQAEEALNNNQPYIAIKHVAKSMGLSDVDKKHSEILSKQVDEYLKSNSNSFAFISNVERILKGEKPEKLVKYYKPRKTSINKKAVDNAVAKALAAKGDREENVEEEVKDVEEGNEEQEQNIKENSL